MNSHLRISRPESPAPALARADLHVHTTASEESKLGVQRSVGLPECATPPEEVHELAKRRGMDFVAVTDHDTIDGAMAIADRPDVIVGEELTAWFSGEPQAVHVLCWGITPGDHEWLQAHRHDVQRCATYLHEHEIATALAHPFYAVEAPLSPRHLRRLVDLFPVWETRNGSRAPELNHPAAVYVDTAGRTGVGGSDDHAGVDVGRTWTATPPAATPAEFLRHVRAGRATVGGDQGSAEKWTHSAIALAVRALGAAEPGVRARPEAVLEIVRRFMSEGDARRGADEGAAIGPDDARAMLRAWLDSIGLADVSGPQLLARFQSDGFAHRDLRRRAERHHERALGAVVRDVAATLERGERPELSAATALFDAALPVVPYAAATAFLGREKGKLAPAVDGAPARVALVADGIGGMHGVTHTLDELRDRGVEGHEVEVVGTDGNVDRRLPTVAEVDIPFYEGLRVGVPTLTALVETLAEGRYDAVHLVSPGPSGVMAAGAARLLDLPVVTSYHTELASYAGLRSGDEVLEGIATYALGVFYEQGDAVLTPSPQSDAAVAELGVPPERIHRWDRGVDVARFAPAHRRADALPGEVSVLYAGRLTLEKGADLLVDAFLTAQERDPRLHLCLVGGGPEEAEMRRRLGDRATFLGWLEGDALAVAYASADAFLFASRTDTFGQVLVEAQASGVPVVAVDEGGPRSIVRDGETGLLRPAEPEALAEAVLAVTAGDALAGRLRRGGLRAIEDRTWAASLGRLADGYRAARRAGDERDARRAVELSRRREEARQAGLPSGARS